MNRWVVSFLMTLLVVGCVNVVPATSSSVQQRGSSISKLVTTKANTARECLIGTDATLTVLKVGSVGQWGQYIQVAYDRNGDGKPDYAEWYEVIYVKNGKPRLKPFPFRYIVSDYKDDVVDHVYLDVQGNGRCEDLRELGKEPERWAKGAQEQWKGVDFAFLRERE